MLGDWRTFGTWRGAFMINAETAGVAEFYETPGYEDPDVANAIDTRTFAQLVREAENEVPPVDKQPKLIKAYDERKKIVSSKVTEAIKAKCSEIRAERARHARNFLLEALHPKLQRGLRHISDPFELWQAIEVKAASIDDDTKAVNHLNELCSLEMKPNDDIEAFLEKFNGLWVHYCTTMYNVVLPNENELNKAAHEVVNLTCDAVINQTKAMFLLRCLSQAVSPEVLQEWHKTFTAHGYDFLKQSVVDHFVSRGENKAKQPKKKKKEPTCAYCGASSHVDAMCNTLYLDKIHDCVVKGYKPPNYEALCTYCQSPAHQVKSCKYRKSDKDFGIHGKFLPKKRVCSYCFMLNHIDARCQILQTHVYRGTVRSDYKIPQGQLLPSPVRRVNMCDYCCSYDHRSDACTLLQKARATGIYRLGYEPNPQNLAQDIDATERNGIVEELSANKKNEERIPQVPKEELSSASPGAPKSSSPAQERCSYCDGNHSETFCVKLHIDQRNRRVQKGYKQPSKSTVQCRYCYSAHHKVLDCHQRKMDMRAYGLNPRTMPYEQSCTYCKINGHLDAGCPVLSVHIRDNTVRKDYRIPCDQKMPPPAGANTSVCSYCLAFNSHSLEVCRRYRKSCEVGVWRDNFPWKPVDEAEPMSRPNKRTKTSTGSIYATNTNSGDSFVGLQATREYISIHVIACSNHQLNKKYQNNGQWLMANKKMVLSGAYKGELLLSYDEFDGWHEGFMHHARLVDIAEYLTNKNYDDPNIADRISAAKMHLIRANAEVSEPEISSKLHPEAYEQASERRQRHVNDRVTLAVMAECTAIQTRVARFAKFYLLSALSPALQEDLAGLPGAFEVWEALRTRCHAPTVDYLSAFDQVAVTKYIRREEATHFFDRFEHAIDRFLKPVLASSRAPNAKIKDALADKLRSTFLSHAFAPHLVQDFTTWRNEKPNGDYEYFKAKAKEKLASLPPDAFTLENIVLGRTVNEDKPIYCEYCHSRKHRDENCRHLYFAISDGVVREGYKLPQRVPTRLQDTQIDSKRRFCNYCQSHKHNDTVCATLQQDVDNGCVRSSYTSRKRQREHSANDEESQRKPPPPRFCSYCDSMYHHDTACSKLADDIKNSNVRNDYVVQRDHPLFNQYEPHSNLLVSERQR